MVPSPTFEQTLPQHPEDDTVVQDQQGRWWQYSEFSNSWSRFHPLPDDELDGIVIESGQAYSYGEVADQGADLNAPSHMCHCGEVDFQIRYGDYKLITVCRNGHETVAYSG